MKLSPGSIVFADLGAHEPGGHEQEGARPCLVVGNPALVHSPRFRVVLVSPMTKAELPACTLYPRLAAGDGGLARGGTVLLDQTRAIDLRGVMFLIGSLEEDAYRPVAEGLRAIFQL